MSTRNRIAANISDADSTVRPAPCVALHSWPVSPDGWSDQGEERAVASCTQAHRAACHGGRLRRPPWPVDRRTAAAGGRDRAPAEGRERPARARGLGGSARLLPRQGG